MLQRLRVRFPPGANCLLSLRRCNRIKSALPVRWLAEYRSFPDLQMRLTRERKILNMGFLWLLWSSRAVLSSERHSYFWCPTPFKARIPLFKELLSKPPKLWKFVSWLGMVGIEQTKKENDQQDRNKVVSRILEQGSLKLWISLKQSACYFQKRKMGAESWKKMHFFGSRFLSLISLVFLWKSGRVWFFDIFFVRKIRNF